MDSGGARRLAFNPVPGIRGLLLTTVVCAGTHWGRAWSTFQWRGAQARVRDPQFVYRLGGRSVERNLQRASPLESGRQSLLAARWLTVARSRWRRRAARTFGFCRSPSLAVPQLGARPSAP